MAKYIKENFDKKDPSQKIFMKLLPKMLKQRVENRFSIDTVLKKLLEYCGRYRKSKKSIKKETEVELLPYFEHYEVIIS